ncbi:MAG: hypothetical protein RLZZ338_1662 [Cyanobacteriota bacterium]|jgi:ADP-ribosylglycohydrolase
MDATLINKIRGVIYGHVIADALGLGTEFMSKEEISTYYPNGLRDYQQIIRKGHQGLWECGDWTDDTDQMLCIVDSLLKHKSVMPRDIALRLYCWAQEGHPGIGATVFSVLFSRNFFSFESALNPHLIAQQVWEESGGECAANGGIMRTSILGIWDYLSPEKVIENAENVCKITHYDPRCVGSCVAVCLAISSLLKGVSNINNLIQDISSQVSIYHPQISEYFDLAATGDLSTLKLNGAGKIGYTLKAMGAGFWALQYAQSYEDGILQIIHEGGDADTNAAVAGGLLGAKFGFDHIPQKWVEGLLYQEELASKTEAFINLLEEEMSSVVDG